jgi:hypothetical protein
LGAFFFLQFLTKKTRAKPAKVVVADLPLCEHNALRAAFPNSKRAEKLCFYFMCSVKAALCGHDNGKNFGSLTDPSRDLLQGAVATADCFGKEINLRTVGSMSYTSWCSGLIDQLHKCGEEGLDFDVAMEAELAKPTAVDVQVPGCEPKGHEYRRRAKLS